ncbi:MAG: serine acetyltransferase [Saprospiraceae bacterium]|nr:serine acetyltransferase [Saprospiraceae bacterium]MCB0573317.1 serine acetyltransferase [Saprospiraceae bacterium]
MNTELEQFFNEIDSFQATYANKIPSAREAQRLADGLFHFLFPILSDDPKPARVQYATLRHDLISALIPLLYNKSGAATLIADRFFQALPRIQKTLLEDARAILEFDPAATCLEEVLATYPGFHAIAVYRIANLLHRLGAPLLPRFFSEYLHGKTGIDIHPAANIGHAFFIDHGTGIVVGETAVIGNNVKLYQGVTLGALQVKKSLANTKRHPTIEDNCILYANCTILGGQTVVGHDSVVGGNSWLTESIPPYSVVTHHTEVKVRSRPFEEPVNFII